MRTIQDIVNEHALLLSREIDTHVMKAMREQAPITYWLFQHLPLFLFKYISKAGHMAIESRENVELMSRDFKLVVWGKTVTRWRIYNSSLAPTR